MANHQDKVVTFCQYHKINVDRLKEDLAVSAFVAYPSDDIDPLYEQYVSSLSDLLDIHAPNENETLHQTCTCLDNKRVHNCKMFAKTI